MPIYKLFLLLCGNKIIQAGLFTHTDAHCVTVIWMLVCGKLSRPHVRWACTNNSSSYSNIDGHVWYRLSKAIRCLSTSEQDCLYFFNSKVTATMSMTCDITLWYSALSSWTQTIWFLCRAQGDLQQVCWRATDASVRWRLIRFKGAVLRIQTQTQFVSALRGQTLLLFSTHYPQ